SVTLADPLRDTAWHAGTALPQALLGASAAAESDGRLFVFGGFTNGSGISNGVEIYDQATRIWSKGSAMPIPVAYSSAVAANGQIFLFGGISTSGIPLSTVLVYDPTLDRWSVSPRNMPTPRYGLAAVLGADGTIYTFGGEAIGPGGAPAFLGSV